jgi:hypothetical protein
MFSRTAAKAQASQEASPGAAKPPKYEKSYRLQYKVRLTGDEYIGAYARAAALGLSFSRYVARLIEHDLAPSPATYIDRDLREPLA